MIFKKYNKLTMADKGLERSAKVVTAGTPTPNPICKIFLPKFEISISDKRKKRNDSKYMFTLVFTNIKKLQKMLEYLQNNRFFGTRFRARAKAKVTSRLSVKARTQKRSKREESKLCKYESTVPL